MRGESVEDLYARSRRLYAAGNLAGAIEMLRRAATLFPPRVEILNDLGLLLRQAGCFEESIDMLRRAVDLDPSHPEPHANLGNSLRAAGDLAAAISAYRDSLKLAPDHPITLNNLAATLWDTGELDETLVLARRALALAPDHPALHSNLLYALHFHPDSTPASLLSEHRAWAERISRDICPMPPVPPSDFSSRKIRVGYLSPDFREHVISRFLRPILGHHDRLRFEIYCYSNLALPPDGVTREIQAGCDHWRTITALTDEQAAEMIRRDGIDILVDLSMHMSNNRLLVFARRPAPVQVTYLAYAGTTGLAAIDYRITDPHLDPAGADEYYTERSIRLPDCYWCYQPPFSLPEPAPLPALAAGHITFGSLNNFRKVSRPALETWARCLQRVSGSHLHLHCARGPHRPRLLAFFSSRGVSAERIRFLDPVPLADYFSLYNEIDIALDPFPYAGGTTTCDAAYMGAPTVTLAGSTAVGRGGVSIFSTLSLPELIAGTPEEYVRIAGELAGDIPRLAGIRGDLRSRMRSSPLMDAGRFTHHLEAAYRRMLAGGS